MPAAQTPPDDDYDDDDDDDGGGGGGGGGDDDGHGRAMLLLMVMVMVTMTMTMTMTSEFSPWLEPRAFASPVQLERDVFDRRKAALSGPAIAHAGSRARKQGGYNPEIKHTRSNDRPTLGSGFGGYLEVDGKGVLRHGRTREEPREHSVDRDLKSIGDRQISESFAKATSDFGKLREINASSSW
eukprot:3859170-Rhodomonas_salina.1